MDSENPENPSTSNQQARLGNDATHPLTTIVSPVEAKATPEPTMARNAPSILPRSHGTVYIDSNYRIVPPPPRAKVRAPLGEYRRRCARIGKRTYGPGERWEFCKLCVKCHVPTEAYLQPCGHYFHLACIRNWLRYENYCPFCQCQL